MCDVILCNLSAKSSALHPFAYGMSSSVTHLFNLFVHHLFMFMASLLCDLFVQNVCTLLISVKKFLMHIFHEIPVPDIPVNPQESVIIVA